MTVALSVLLILLLPITSSSSSGSSSNASTTTVTNSYNHNDNNITFTANIRSCSDNGIITDLPSPQHCQTRCTIHPTCQYFSYDTTSRSHDCRLCSDDTHEQLDCPGAAGAGEVRTSTSLGDDGTVEDHVCAWQGTIGNESNTAIVERLIKHGMVIAEHCSDYEEDEVLQVVNGWNAIMGGMAEGENSVVVSWEGNDVSLFADAVAKSLKGGDDRGLETMTEYCRLLHWQLRVFLMLADGNWHRIYPRDEFRSTIFNNHDVIVADDGYFGDVSLWVINRFYDECAEIKSHVKNDGSVMVLSTKGVYSVRKERGNEMAAFLRIGSGGGIEVVREHFGASFVPVFPEDTPQTPPRADKLLTSLRHETARHFLKNQIKESHHLQTLLHSTLALLKEDDPDPDDYLMYHPSITEMLAFQLGPQYLYSSFAQLRLAAHRTHRGHTGGSAVVMPNAALQHERLSRLSSENEMEMRNVGIDNIPHTTCRDGHVLGDGYVAMDECMTAAIVSPFCTSVTGVSWNRELQSCKCCSSNVGVVAGDIVPSEEWDLYMYSSDDDNNVVESDKDEQQQRDHHYGHGERNLRGGGHATVTAVSFSKTPLLVMEEFESTSTNSSTSAIASKVASLSPVSSSQREAHFPITKTRYHLRVEKPSSRYDGARSITI